MSNFNSVSQFKSEVRPKTLGADFDGANLYNEMGEAYRIMRTKISPKDLVFTATLTKSIVWSEDYGYILPDDFYELIDIAIGEDKFDFGRFQSGIYIDKENYEITTINGERMLLINNDRLTNDEDLEIRILYQTAYPFVDETDPAQKVYKARPTKDSDKIYVDDDAYQILMQEAILIHSAQLQGEDAAFNFRIHRDKLRELYRSYRGRSPKEEQQYTTFYSEDVRKKYGTE